MAGRLKQAGTLVGKLAVLQQIQYALLPGKADSLSTLSASVCSASTPPTLAVLEARMGSGKPTGSSGPEGCIHNESADAADAPVRRKWKGLL